MSGNRVLTMCLSGAVVIALCIGFVFLPDGWGFIPFLLGGLVLAGLSLRTKALGCPPDAHPVEQVPVAGKEEVPAARKGKHRPSAAKTDAPDDTKVARRMNHAFGPIVAGLIIDLVDLATFGPVGRVLGLLVGGIAGYWMGSALGFDKRASLWCALGAGVYCTIPGTEIIPLATIIGACFRFWETGKR